MSVLEQAKSTLKTPRGKALAAVAAGGLVYLWWSRSGSSPTDTTPAATPTTTDRIPPVAAVPTDTTPVDARPRDNHTWLSQCVSALSNPPYNYDSATVYNALRLALDGAQITAVQQEIVSKAISLKGSPPEGMPPLNTTPPTNPPPPSTPAPFTVAVSAGQKVDAFAVEVNQRAGKQMDWAYLERTNPTLAGNINWGPSGSKDTSIRTFKRAASYLIIP